MHSDKLIRLARRRAKIRRKIFGTNQRPRLVIFRSNRHLQTQLIDDVAGKTLLGLADSKKSIKKDQKLTKIEIATILGENLAQKAKKLKITRVVFDRRGYKYHGRVKALAEGARKGSLKF